MKTQAAFFKAPWQTEIRDVELPEPPPNWVRVRVEACGVCGTDVTSIQTARDWQPFGHEIAGVVEAAGPGVTNVAPGLRVALESGSACGVCARCRNGRPALCLGGMPSYWGQPSLGCAR
ncbi:MAG: alcohol dehydrogenase catalytic domain-containing protein, partial [Kiritimatiellaeota bacterium]|nr:alcohol dehydrogenase catalytic domain-containing protein [Kiritimatiellota bacterium]